MSERPILFSAPMVRAILAGTKTQTRRLVTHRTSFVDGSASTKVLWSRLPFEVIAWVDQGPSPAGNAGPYLKVPDPSVNATHRVYPRWWSGDRLWLRETWRLATSGDDDSPHYRADEDEPEAAGCWRPSIHMPRWASRIDLVVTGVRVERLQSITEDDSKAEGVTAAWLDENGEDVNAYGPPTYRQGFARTWSEINGARAPWASNPWVWVISFRRVRP